MLACGPEFARVWSHATVVNAQCAARRTYSERMSHVKKRSFLGAVATPPPVVPVAVPQPMRRALGDPSMGTALVPGFHRRRRCGIHSFRSCLTQQTSSRPPPYARRPRFRRPVSCTPSLVVPSGCWRPVLPALHLPARRRWRPSRAPRSSGTGTCLRRA